VQPPGDGYAADCVAQSPGGPVHVLLSDDIAEHIPGCNMAFRKDALVAIGGFDPRFRSAGDDVDICWRLQDRGWTIGYCPVALVWHHHRNSLGAYWKQQSGYGKAEALLEGKWPQRYNMLGHASWAGRIYGHGSMFDRLHQRIYHGVWGTAPFQSLHQRDGSAVLALLVTPEWYLWIAVLAGLTATGLLWPPLLMLWPLLLAAIAGRIAEAGIGASRAPILYRCATRGERLKCWSMLAALHFLQPIARLYGRLRHGLTPWRLRTSHPATLPGPKSTAIWSEVWREPEAWVRMIYDAVGGLGARVSSGGAYDRWDLEVPGGALAGARLLVAVEDHGGGTQYIRIRQWPTLSSGGLAVLMLPLSIAGVAGLSRAWLAALLFTGVAGLVTGRMIYEGGRAMSVFEAATDDLSGAARRATDDQVDPGMPRDVLIIGSVGN
jgi:hypothetical protein